MKREEKWEMLRAISCISVVLLHVAALYTEEVDIYQQYSGIGFSFCDFLQIMTRFAVPCFVMLSGSFMLDKQYYIFADFYKSSIRKLLIPTLFFELVYITANFFIEKNVVEVIKNVVAGKLAGHLWFMFMLMGLYAVFPALYFFKQKVSPKSFGVFSVLMVLLSCSIHFTCKLIWPLQFLEYLGYFLMGNYLRKNGMKFWGSTDRWLLISGIFLFMTFMLNEYQFYYGTYNSSYFRNPNFPTVIVASICIFVAFTKMEIGNVPSLLLEIAKRSMVIYMLHPLVLNMICKIVRIIGGGVFAKSPSLRSNIVCCRHRSDLYAFCCDG